MNTSRAIDLYLDALTYARSALRTPTVLVPFALFAIVQGLILFALASFASPLVAPVMVPLLRFLGGEQSMHYPLHLVGLPSVYQRVYLPLVATLGFALWTLGVWMLVDRHTVGMERPRRPFRRALPHVMLIGLFFVGASVITGETASRLTGPRTPEMVARAIFFISVTATAIVQTFLVYAPLVLRLRGGTAWGAIRASAGYARRHFPATAFLITTVLVAHLPLDVLLGRADRIAARFHPEVVLQVMFASVALEMFTAFLLFAGVTRLALPREGGLR